MLARFGDRHPRFVELLSSYLATADIINPLFTQVDKQEKKKKKTGRAKRRMQYNRRFVNVVQTFGRRRGPNSNAP